MAEPIVIFDNGSINLKAGLSSFEDPLIKIPLLIGRPNIKKKLEDIELKSIMIGDEILPELRPLLDLTYPMKNGIIIDEDDMAILWDYCIRKKLRINDDLKDRKIFLTEEVFNTFENRKKIAEIIFEKLNFGYFNMEAKAKLALYSHGLDSGIALEIKDEVTYSIPVFENYILPRDIKILDIGGRHITEYLVKLLQIKGYQFFESKDFELAKEIKEKYCFVSCDINSDKKLNFETTYYNSIHELPDGRKIMISNEKFEAPEILFNPYLIRNESPGIDEMLFESINVRYINLIIILNLYYRNVI